LGYLLNRVATALRTEVTATVLEPVGLTLSQYVCLRILARSSGMSNAELARAAAVSGCGLGCSQLPGVVALF
jgi:DNA-binding MarR family transcriptional regulator